MLMVMFMGPAYVTDSLCKKFLIYWACASNYAS